MLTPLIQTENHPNVMAGIKPKCWRLTNSQRDGEEPEEIVVRVQGILAGMDLPPISNTLIFLIHSGLVPYMESITINGK